MSRRRHLLAFAATTAALLTLAPLTPAHAEATGPFTITVAAPGGTHVYGEAVTATVTVLDATGAPTPDVGITMYADNSWCNDQATGTTDATGVATINVKLFCRQDLLALADSSADGLYSQRSDNAVHEEVSLPLSLSVPSAKRPYWAVHATVGGLSLRDGAYVDRDQLTIQRHTATGWRTVTGMPSQSQFGTDPLVWDANAGTNVLRVVYPGDDRSDGFAPSASAAVNFVVGEGTVPRWLRQLNHYRRLAKLPKVGEDPYKDAADQQHINYMVKNDYYGHSEDPHNRYFTPIGNDGGTHSDIYKGIPCDEAIPGWLVTPYHSEPMLAQNTYTMGFDCEKGYAALYVYDDTQIAKSPSYPQTWPAAGGKMPLHRFGGGEIPDPLVHCPAKWTKRRDNNVGMGAALLAFTSQQMTNVTARLTDNGQATPVCAFRDYKTVFLLPLYPLKGKHDYRVSLSSSNGSLSWTFHG